MKAKQHPSIPLPVRLEIEAHWRSRAAAQGLKPGSAKRRHAALEFYCGAMAALCATHGGLHGKIPDGLAGWVLLLHSGREPGEKES